MKDLQAVKTHCNTTAPLLAVLQHPTSLCSCCEDEGKRALRVFLAPHKGTSNWVFRMFYCFVCILCIFKKRQTNLEVCFTNTALIGCFLFYQQERKKQLFRQPTLRSWDDAFAWKKPFACPIQLGIPGSSPYTRFAPIHLGLVPFWWAPGGGRWWEGPQKRSGTPGAGGEDSMRADSCGRLVGHAGELGHVPSPLRRTQRVTVMSFCGRFWNLQMKSLSIKAKYYYCHFYSHSTCLCLEHSAGSALIFNTNRKKKNT